MDAGAINNKLGHSFAMSIGVNAREDDCAKITLALTESHSVETRQRGNHEAAHEQQPPETLPMPFSTL